MEKTPLDRLNHIENQFETIREIIQDLGQRVKEKNSKIETLNGTSQSNNLSEKKNSHLHILLETSLTNKLKAEAENKNVSIAELVRQKLRGDEQLDRIERKIDSLRTFK